MDPESGLDVDEGLAGEMWIRSPGEKPPSPHSSPLGETWDPAKRRSFPFRAGMSYSNSYLAKKVVMKGYHNLPDKTGESIVQGGWFRTGDAVKVTRGGHFVVVDRIKELVRRPSVRS